MHATATSTQIKRFSSVSGQLYAAIFLLAPLGFIVGKMQTYAPGDAAATTEQLLANETVFRLGLVAEVGVVVVELVLAAMLYTLFRPASRTLAMGIALTRAAEAVIQAVNLLPSMIALAAATGTGVYATMSDTARETVVLGAMDAYQHGIFIWGIPFALHVLFLGLAVARSGLTPKVIGWLLVVASAGYFADSLAPMAFPAASGITETAVLIVAIPAELAFAVWMIIRGVRQDRWRELSAAANGGAELQPAEPAAAGTR